MNKIFYNGAAVKGLTAEQVAQVLTDHYGSSGLKKLSAKNLADDAKVSSHPLHHYFEWDDAIAADLHRIQQARILIASIMVEREDGIKHRLFYNIMEDDIGNDVIGFNSTESKYLSIDKILGDPILREKMLTRAGNELIAFKQKYVNLTELIDVFDAIDKLKNK